MRPPYETWDSLLMHAKANLMVLCFGEHVSSKKHAWVLIVQPQDAAFDMHLLG